MPVFIALDGVNSFFAPTKIFTDREYSYLNKWFKWLAVAEPVEEMAGQLK